MEAKASRKVAVVPKEKRRPPSWKIDSTSGESADSQLNGAASVTNTPRKLKGLTFATPRGLSGSKSANLGARSSMSLTSTPKKPKELQNSAALFTEETTPTFKRDSSVRMSPKVERSLESMVLRELSVKKTEPIVIEDAWFS
mmetsp:Transcript_7168/g.19197  ORF Transcript_7168/g.19197 Transcript_7168/m.19197 type:complete len:142 (-) Transcript_7168:3609-4034(-)